MLAEQARLRDRRGLLLAALRSGDDVAAARAASRARVGASLGTAESAAARAARLRLGREIRLARQRRADPAAFRLRGVAPAAPAPRRSRPVVAAALSLVVLGGLSLPGTSAAQPVGRLGDPGVAQPSVVEGVARLSGRGRTSASLATVDPGTPTYESAPPIHTAAPQAPTPARALALPASVGAGTGSGPAGGAAGTTGVEGALPEKPTPAQLIALIPPAVADGYFRISVQVLDDATGDPLPGVCVIVGTADCSAGRPHTNLLGLWTTDVPKAASATDWDIDLVFEGYQPVHYDLTTSGRDVWIDIRLRR